MSHSEQPFRSQVSASVIEQLARMPEGPAFDEELHHWVNQGADPFEIMEDVGVARARIHAEQLSLTQTSRVSRVARWLPIVALVLTIVSLFGLGWAITSVRSLSSEVAAQSSAPTDDGGSSELPAVGSQVDALRTQIAETNANLEALRTMIVGTTTASSEEPAASASAEPAPAATTESDPTEPCAQADAEEQTYAEPGIVLTLPYSVTLHGCAIDQASTVSLQIGPALIALDPLTLSGTNTDSIAVELPADVLARPNVPDFGQEVVVRVNLGETLPQYELQIVSAAVTVTGVIDNGDPKIINDAIAKDPDLADQLRPYSTTATGARVIDQATGKPMEDWGAYLWVQPDTRTDPSGNALHPGGENRRQNNWILVRNNDQLKILEGKGNLYKVEVVTNQSEAANQNFKTAIKGQKGWILKKLVHGPGSGT